MAKIKKQLYSALVGPVPAGRCWTPPTFKALKELRERLRYLVDRAFAREFAGQLLLFGVLVVIVTMYGMSAALFGLFGDENAAVDGIPRQIDGGFWDSMWWSVTYIVRLPAFENMYGASGPILFYALTLSIMGLAVFGVLVSLINNAMRRRIELLRQGDTPVKERGHVLILGWNNRMTVVLRQLARLKPGARVVILASAEIGAMTDALRVAGISRERLVVILRSGVPSNRAELDRVAVERASAIIVLSDGSEDSEAIKTLVLLASIDRWPRGRPSLTAEVSMEQNFELAEIGARDRLHVVSASRVTSKVIVQTIRNRGLAKVYDELMSLDGNSLSVQHIAGCAGKTLRDIAYGFSGAIPIGITWEEEEGDVVRHKAGLNPEPDYDLSEDEHLVMLSRGVPVDYRPAASVYTSEIFCKREAVTRVPQRILLIGWSDILYDILRELNAHATLGTTVTVLTGLDEDGFEDKVGAHTRGMLENLTLDIRRGDATQRAAYDDLQMTGFDSVVVLADETTEEDPDTRALRVLLRLSEHEDHPRFKDCVVVELLDGANRDLLTGLGVRDIVVSSDVISAQLAQISQQTVLGSIYRELLGAGGVEISLRAAHEYIQPDTPCRFEDLIFAAQQHSEIALGVYLAEDRMLLNPPRDEQWQLGRNDRLIVLAQQLYR